MHTILTGIRSIHQVGDLIGEPDLADMAAFIQTGIVPIMVAGTIHGILVAGVDIIPIVDLDTMAEAIMAEAMADIMADTAEAIGAVVLLISATGTTEDKTTPVQEARIQ